MIAQSLVESSGINFDILGTIAILIGIGTAIIGLSVAVVIFYFVKRFLDQNDYTFSEGIGEIWESSKNVFLAERMERFQNSPVGRILADHSARAGVHGGVPVEWRSLGPNEEISGGDFSGYESDYGNIEFTDLEDYRYDNS